MPRYFSQNIIIMTTFCYFETNGLDLCKSLPRKRIPCIFLRVCGAIGKAPASGANRHCHFRVQSSGLASRNMDYASFCAFTLIRRLANKRLKDWRNDRFLNINICGRKPQFSKMIHCIIELQRQPTTTPQQQWNVRIFRRHDHHNLTSGSHGITKFELNTREATGSNSVHSAVITYHRINCIPAVSLSKLEVAELQSCWQMHRSTNKLTRCAYILWNSRFIPKGCIYPLCKVGNRPKRKHWTDILSWVQKQRGRTIIRTN